MMLKIIFIYRFHILQLIVKLKMDFHYVSGLASVGAWQ